MNVSRRIFFTLLIGMILMSILFILAHFRMKDEDFGGNESSIPPLSHEQLFVEVNADTIATCVSRDLQILHPSLTVKNLPNQLEIEYNTNANILLDMKDNGMNDESNVLNNSGIVFSNDNKTRIVLKKHIIGSVQYVNCPAPILAEILRNKTKSIHH